MDKKYQELKENCIEVLSTIDKDILVRAVNILEDNPKLAKGRFYDPKTKSYCLLGACNKAKTGSEMYYTWRDCNGNKDIFVFNDYKLTNKQRAISAIKLAIQKQEN